MKDEICAKCGEMPCVESECKIRSASFTGQSKVLGMRLEELRIAVLRHWSVWLTGDSRSRMHNKGGSQSRGTFGEQQ